MKTNNFIMEAKHLAVEIKHPQPEMKHLQAAQKYFELMTEHSGHSGRCAHGNIISAHHDS